jgi:predicted small secreted protein
MDFRQVEALLHATQSFRLRSFSRQTGEYPMLRKVVTMVLIGGSLAIAACNTVRGAASDVNSAANAVDNAT